MPCFLLYRLISIYFIATASARRLRSRDNSTSVYDFSEIKASPTLSWTPCFANFTCANLEVPLDYENLRLGTTNVAFIKAPPVNSSAQDILINPGGPSNSGIDFLLKGAPLLSQMLGPQYTLISFDPRGVNNSGPLLTCFPSSEAAQNVFGRTLGLPVDSNSSTALAEAYELAGGWGQWCSRTNKGGQAGYANTPAVAADLARFVDLRAQELGRKAEDAKLWYYGLSYGSIIGTTFASLFPTKVGRMILDAVPDMQDYYNGASSDNLDDADKAVQMFFMYCYMAGKSGCPFWANGTAAIESRFTNILQAVKADPIVVTDPYFVDMPTLATYQTIQSFILQAVIAPITRFPSFAQLMVGLEAGNGSAIAKNSGFGTLATAPCDEGVGAPREYHMEEPRLIILCNDANGRGNTSSMEGFKHQVSMLVEQSFYLGESWAGATNVNCRSLDIRPPQSQQFSGLPSNTTAVPPMLFVSSSIDPTSSLRGAQKTASMFPNSGFLEIDGVGHGSMTTPSKCAVMFMQNYLSTGKVEADATCYVDSLPFRGKDGGWGKVLKSVY